MESIRFSKYLIVGTGPSIKELSIQDFENIANDVIIVSVNSSILFLPKLDIWFTLDDSPRNLKYAKIAQHRGAHVVMAVESNKVIKNIQYTHINRTGREIPKQLMYSYNCKSPKDWFNRWGCMLGFPRERGVIHTGNSLYGALNLVYFDSPRKVGILGLDGSTSVSAGGGHKPNNLSHLPMLFESTVPQLAEKNIEVKNGSPNSIVNCFDKTSPKKLLTWINSK